MIEVSIPYRRHAHAPRQGARPAAALLVLAAGGILAGCSDRLPDQALDLYHNLQGGPIAEQRPPPPGADDPYPNLGTTPARPPAADPAQQQRIEDTLAAQRDAADAAAARDPLRALPPTPPLPKPPPADPNGDIVTVAGAPAPPAPPVPPRAPPPPPMPDIDSVPPLPTPVVSGPMPELAAAPPPPPTGFGVPSPLPPPTPPITAAPPPGLPNGVAVAFTPGSSTLPPSANLTLRRFALAHHSAAVAVVGRGDGEAHDVDGKVRALELALKRANAIANALNAAGLPPGKVTLRAEAAGTGTSTATLN